MHVLILREFRNESQNYILWIKKYYILFSGVSMEYFYISDSFPSPPSEQKIASY